jgi:hypothetical protein
MYLVYWWREELETMRALENVKIYITSGSPIPVCIGSGR